MGVERGHEHEVVPNRHASVARSAAKAQGACRRKPALVMPEFGAGPCVDRKHMVPGRGQVDHAVHGERHPRQAVGHTRLKAPDGHEVLNGGPVDPGQRREARLAVVAGIHEPVARVGGRFQESIRRDANRRRPGAARRLDRLGAQIAEQLHERLTSGVVDARGKTGHRRVRDPIANDGVNLRGRVLRVPAGIGQVGCRATLGRRAVAVGARGIEEQLAFVIGLPVRRHRPKPNGHHERKHSEAKERGRVHGGGILIEGGRRRRAADESSIFLDQNA